MTLKDDILAALQSECTLQELYQLFPERSTSSIRGTVNYLVYDGVVQRTGEGKYQLTGTDTHEAEPTAQAPPTADISEEDTSGVGTAQTSSDADTTDTTESHGRDTTDSRTAEEAETDAKEKEVTETGVEQEDREPGRTRARSQTDMNQVLMGALKKFAEGGEGRREEVEGEATTTSKTRTGTRGVVLPDFDEARKVLEPEGYDFRENFPFSLGEMDALINPAKTLGVAGWDDEKPEGDVYRLPNQLVENGRLARTSWGSFDSGSSRVRLKPLFDCLKDLGKRNNERMRKSLRFFVHGTHCYAYVPGNRILFAMVKSDDTSLPSRYLVRV